MTQAKCDHSKLQDGQICPTCGCMGNGEALTGAALARWCYENPNLAARTIEGLRGQPCDQCPEPMEGPHHPECYRFFEPPAERWEVGKNGWDASDEITREDI